MLLYAYKLKGDYYEQDKTPTIKNVVARLRGN